MTLITLVRHGETEWSRQGKHTGTTEAALTDTGRLQAKALGAVLGTHAYDLVLSSPRQRAIDTARLAGFEPEIEPHLAEWDYGDYEGLTSAQIWSVDPDWCLWVDGCPGGESPGQVAERAERVLRRCTATTLLFAHGHILRCIAARYSELGTEAGRRLSLSPAARCVLGWEHDDRTIVLWNDTSHLAGL
jgi:broad specificity phosphatase PhoE